MGIIIILFFLLIGIVIGNYGGSPFASLRFMVKWLIAKMVYDFVQFIITKIVTRYTYYFPFIFGSAESETR